jgi:hypothetical protein
MYLIVATLSLKKTNAASPELWLFDLFDQFIAGITNTEDKDRTRTGLVATNKEFLWFA